MKVTCNCCLNITSVNYLFYSPFMSVCLSKCMYVWVGEFWHEAYGFLLFYNMPFSKLLYFHQQVNVHTNNKKRNSVLIFEWERDLSYLFCFCCCCLPQLQTNTSTIGRIYGSDLIRKCLCFFLT